MTLGSGFEWCADVQDAWDSHDIALQAALASVGDYNQALAAAHDATDDLDRAEALEQLKVFEDHLEDAVTVRQAGRLTASRRLY